MDDKKLANLLEDIKKLLDGEILKYGIVKYCVDWKNLRLHYEEDYKCSAKAEFNKEEYTVEEILNMAIERLNK